MSTKTTHEDATINRKAGGGMRGSKRIQITQQSAVMEVEKWEKIQQLLDKFAAAREVMQTQQPTGHTDNNNNEQMQRAGEEGGSRNNTTINQSG